MESLLTFIVLGCFSGVIAGLLGVGGGLVIVPILSALLLISGVSTELVVHIAIGTSLATIIPTSISSAWAHHKHKAVLWHVVIRITPGIIIGALLGAWLADWLASAQLRNVFACFEFTVAAWMIWGHAPNKARETISAATYGFAGLVIGSISSLLGIGGGTLTVPFLTWSGTPLPKAIGSSAACGLPIAIAGAFGFVLTGINETGLPDYSSGYLYWPAFVGISVASVVFAPIGAKLAHRLPVPALKKVFAGFLVLLGVKMLLG
ncbi:MAG: sulfite exporter TauE/SafE family protein [Proteobacteria bacterium]|nr:sulfite exporter TauE/SafE family protein [Pseudomonadota bacterium]